MFNKYCVRKNIKFIWTLVNSSNQLYNQIVKYSMYNCTTIIGENVRYFMNKYHISRDYWNCPINILYNKIDLYSTPANTNVFLTFAQGCGFVIFVFTFLERSDMDLIWLV